MGSWSQCISFFWDREPSGHPIARQPEHFFGEWEGYVFHDKTYLLFFTVEDKDYFHLSSAGKVLGVVLN